MNTNTFKKSIASYIAFMKQKQGKAKPCTRFQEEIELAEALAYYPQLTPAEREDVQSVFYEEFDDERKNGPDARMQTTRSTDAYFNANKLAGFAIRCASFALQTNKTEYLRQGALALIIDRDVMDSRNIITSLGILYLAAGRLGVNLFPDVMAPLLEFTTPGRRKLIEDFFFVRPKEMNGLKNFGYEIVNSEGGPWFQRVPL